MSDLLTRHNPDTMHRNPAFSQAVSVDGPHRTIYVGGQNAVASDGTVPDTDIGAQTTRTLQNIETVLADAGAQITDIVTWSIRIMEGQSLEAGFGAFLQFWGDRGEPPAIDFLFVPALANPAFLIEMTAIAVVSAPASTA